MARWLGFASVSSTPLMPRHKVVVNGAQGHRVTFFKTALASRVNRLMRSRIARFWSTEAALGTIGQALYASDMTEPNQTAYILKVTRPDAGLPNGRLTMFYAVISDDADTAVRLVQEAVKEDAEVKMTEARLSQDTAQAIGLSPGYARAL